MKGIHGLVLALILGIAGASLNYVYLTKKSADLEKVYFIGVKPNVFIDRGQRLTAADLTKVGIPKRSAGNLSSFVYKYADLQSVEGMPVWRSLTGGSLLLHDDLKTPSQELQFDDSLPPGEQERALPIPVNTKAFVPSLLMPGDSVSFLIASPRAGPNANKTEIIGPFKILSLGNRLGSSEVLRASKIPQIQENVIIVSVKLENGQLEPRAQKLWDLLQATNFRQAGILMHPRKK